MRSRFLVTGTILVASLLLGVLGGRAMAERDADPYGDLDLFARVLTQVQSHHVDALTTRDLVEAALRGLSDPLDPHSRWMSAREYQDFLKENEGEYEGIGIEVREGPEGVVLTRVRPGGPAARDGLRVGDVLTHANGVPLLGKPMSEVTLLLRGPRGTPVALRVSRGGAQLDIRTVRDRIELVPVTSAALPGGVAYVQLTDFQEGAARDVERAFRELRKQGHEAGLILDLRDNPGGLLDEAVALVDLFVDAGVIVTTRGRTEGEQVRSATRGGLGTEVPLIVLINGDSASASEVVSGALQDLGRARLVGTHTFGKGTVQSVFGQRDGSALKLTIARYYTPSGLPVAADTGRVPDVVVPFPTAPGPRAALRERLLAASLPEDERAALLALVQELPDDEEVGAVIPWDVAPADRLDLDPQLQAAWRLLQR